MANVNVRDTATTSEYVSFTQYFDNHSLFAYSTVATAPSPATTGTSITVQSGDGTKFNVSQNCTVWPVSVQPTLANAEVVRITAISGDTLTIQRSQEMILSRSIIIGDQIANTITPKVFTDIEHVGSANQIIFNSGLNITGDPNLTWDGTTFVVNGLTTIGSATGTGTLTFGQSTAGETLNIESAVHAASTVYRVNIGYNASSDSTSRTILNIGDANESSQISFLGGGAAGSGGLFFDAAPSDGIISIGTSTSGTITFGNTSSLTRIRGSGATNAITIQTASGGFTLIGGGTNNNTTIGSTGANGTTLTLGQSTGSETINIENGVPGNLKTNTVNIGAPATATGTGKTVVKVGSQVNASSLTLQAGTGNLTVNAASSLFSGIITQYNNVATAGLGVPAIYGQGRSTAQTAAVASVATYTVGAADASFIISANANITAFVAGTFNVQATYTDETNTARTLNLNFSSLTGTLGIALAAAGPFEGIPAHIRAKASTAITILTAGTFTSLTYNVEGYITQIG